ncbi:MAG: hypothetical protein RRY72_05275 [Bacteroides sp.]
MEKEEFIELLEFIGRENISGALGSPMNAIIIKTANGDMNVYSGDYILKGENGELYTCSPNEFYLHYERLPTEIPFGLSFGTALDQVKLGRGMRLSSWAEGVVVRLCHSEEMEYGVQEESTAATALTPTHYLYLQSSSGRVRWKESMKELFSNDWEVID